MDPFNIKKEELTFDEDNKIILWKDKKGRKTNTYFSGWNLENFELKNNLKKLKKTLGCNGSLKKINTDDKNKEEFIVHLQGDKELEIISYLIDNNISENNIVKKG